MEKITFTRHEFYELIWSTPLIQLSKKYAISDNGLRKMCKKYLIPIPKNGYWMKRKFHKPVTPDPLPPFQMKHETIQLVIRTEENPLNVDTPRQTILLRQLKADSNAPLTVPETLIKPHVLIKETKKYWADLKAHQFDRNYDKSLPHLDITVQPSLRKRALRFFNSFIKLMEYRGHTVYTRSHTTYVRIQSIDIKISLREAHNRVFHGEGIWRTSELIPNGKLMLKTGEYWTKKEWREQKKTLEDLLANMAIKLEMDAEREITRKEEARINALKREAALQKQREQEALEKAEADKLSLLITQANNYELAQTLRRYITAAHEEAKKSGHVSEAFQNWIDWATSKADQLDPLLKLHF